MRKLLPNMTVAILEYFTLKNKPVIYTGVFIKFYNWKNHKQVYEIYYMIEFKKIPTSTTKNPFDLSVYQIIEIFSILCSTYFVSRDQNKVVSFVNNYIN